MIVVSDTTAITSLLQISRASLLQGLYGEVIVPGAVQRELLAFHRALPDFVRVEAVRDAAAIQRLLSEIDLGEAEAIVLARRLNADRLLVDDLEARRTAQREGLVTIGLLGVLLEAKLRGVLPSIREVMAELESKARFRVGSEVREAVLRLARE